MNKPKRFAAAMTCAALTVTAAACSSGGGHTAPQPSTSAASNTNTSIDPARYSATIDNPWFPAAPGTVAVYVGTKDGKPARDVVTVTNRTRTIAGVPTRVIDDRLYLEGRLAERTTDYYTQERSGAVWYFGEDTAELDAQGRVISREGTWHAGVDGAVPGVFMEADPTVGHHYRQEFLKGHAEDHFQVLDLSTSVKVPYKSFNSGVVLTKEWTPLEPDVLDHKYYVRGIGEVREIAVKGPLEQLDLVTFRKG